jgi:hypothetical protein
MPINRLVGRKRSQTVQREGVHKNKTSEHINYDRSRYHYKYIGIYYVRYFNLLLDALRSISA